MIIKGYISVSSALKNAKREVVKIYYDADRYKKIHATKYHEPEKRQYIHLERYKDKIEFVSSEEYEKICNERGSGGICAEVACRRYESLEDVIGTAKLICVIDGAEDPFSLGYSIRSAYAAGADAIVMPQRDLSYCEDVILKSSAGAFDIMPVIMSDNLASECDKLKKNGFHITAATERADAKSVYSYNPKKPLCVIFGGEKRGIKREILDMCDDFIVLKYQRQTNYSLPLMQALPVILFEVSRRLR